MTARHSGWPFRRATVEDAEAIGLFHADCWADAYRGIVPDAALDRIDPAERARRWERRLAEGTRATVVAELEGTPRRILGLVAWGPSHDPPEPALPALEVAGLYVARELWGSGLAAALLDLATEGAPAHLWVYEANARARRFYEKHGFAADGRAQVDERTGVAECRYVRRRPLPPRPGRSRLC